MATEVRISGPVLEGRTGPPVERFITHLLDDVAGQAMSEVHQNLDQSIRRPTPYYETQIQLRQAGAHARIVDDRGVIYGPWLEGVGSRNATTRFKGYASFRRARQSVETRVPALAEPATRRLVQELGG